VCKNLLATALFDQVFMDSLEESCLGEFSKYPREDGFARNTSAGLKSADESEVTI
jgi:hypothetical protein